jgi:hypothetical protein
MSDSAMALRAAARLATRAVARAAVRPAMPARVVGVRALSGDHNPYTHSLDLLNTEKVRSGLLSSPAMLYTLWPIALEWRGDA